MPLRRKKFILALQPHEASSPKHGTAWSPLTFGAVLLLLMGLAFPLACGSLTTSSTMNESLTINGSTCFTVTAANVTLDCNGYSLTGDNTVSTYGVYSSQFNTTVKNCVISNFARAVLFENATSSTIQNNTVLGGRQGYTQIYENGGSGNRIIGNNVTHFDYAIVAAGSGTIIANNTVRITTGTVIIASRGYLLYSYAVATNNSFTSSVSDPNFVNAYTVNGANVSIDCQGASLVGSNSSSSYGIYSNQFNTTVKNCNISNFADAIHFNGATGGTISNTTGSTTLTDGDGFYAISTNSIIINNSTFSAISYPGIYFESGSNNTISNIISSSISDTGISLQSGSNNTVSNFTGTSSTNNGCWLYSQTNDTLTNISCTSTSSPAIYMCTSSSSNTIVNSTFRSNSTVAYFTTSSSNNNLTRNTFISGNGATTLIYLNSTASGNTICLNNFTATTGAYVNDTNGSNYYNCTYASKNQGNAYANVLNGSIAVTGTAPSSIPGLNIGTTGAGVPYNNSTSGGKFVCNFANCQDNAPLTPLTCQTIGTPGTYTLSTDLSSPGTSCLSVSTSNVSIDCNGHTITGGNTTNSYGVKTSPSKTNITVKNCNINGFYGGIWLYATTGGNLFNNTITNTTTYGALLVGGTGTYANNSLSSAGTPLYCDSGTGNYTNNTLTTTNPANPLLYTNTGGNTFILNNFTTTSGIYVNDTAGTNSYNGTYNGTNQGNIYANVLTQAVQIQGTNTSSIPNLYIGTAGTGYPYNQTNSQSKFICAGNCADYAPLTPNTFATANLTVSAINGTATGNQTNAFVATAYPISATRLNDSYGFTNWTLNGNCTIASQTESTNLTLNGNCNATANYAFFPAPDTCGILGVAGTIYNMTRDPYGTNATCFNVTAANVTLNCNGHTITGGNISNTFGVYSKMQNTTIKNCIINNFGTGINLYGAQNSLMLNDTILVTIMDGTQNGILTFFSNNTVINGCTINSTSIAVELDNADAMTVMNSRIYAPTFGANDIALMLAADSNMLITNSTITSMDYWGVYLNQGTPGGTTISNCNIFGGTKGIYVFAETGDKITNNTINSTGTTISNEQSSGGSFYLNTLNGNSTLFFTNKGGNSIYLNNFTDTGSIYINDTNGSNSYNGTYGGLNQGNIWADVINGSISVSGITQSSIAELYIGAYGAGQPYNQTKSAKFICPFQGCADYAPLTPFVFCLSATLAFSNLMTPDLYIVTVNTTNNLASYLNIIQLNTTGCAPNTTSYAYGSDGSQINNISTLLSGLLYFNHTNLPVAPGLDRQFTFRAHTILSNGSELDTGNRTIFLLGASSITNGGEDMVGEILILAGVALIYTALGMKEDEVN